MSDLYAQLKTHRFFYPVSYGLIGVVCAYLLFPTGFDYIIFPYNSAQPWWVLLDSSWVMVLNYIKIHDMGWGSDIAFTFGPLGNIATRFGWGESRYLFLTSDLLIGINWALMFYFSLKNSRNKILTLALIVILTLFLPIWIGGRISIYLLLFLAFWMRQNIEQKTVLSFTIQILIISFGFFIKFNTALICLPLYYLGIAYMTYARKLNYIEIIAYSLAPIILIFSLAAALNVSLYGYMTAGLQLISGYNEIMYEDFPLAGTKTFLYLILALVAILMSVQFFTRKDRDWVTRIFIAIVTALPLFVAYKQGFTRSNVGYNEDFFACVVVFFVTASDLHFHYNKKIWQLLVICGPLLAVYHLYFHNEKPFETVAKFSKAGYVEGFSRFSPNSDAFFKSGSPRFPADVLAKLGRHTVDAYPWNIRMLIENEVNYLPRPVLQSYSSYTPALEQLNFDRYNDSATAPDFVLYEYGSLDMRYPLFDESKLNIALKLNYTVEQVFEYDTKKLLLLRKKQAFKPVRFEPVKEYAMLLNSTLEPQKGVFYEVTHYNSLMGKVYGIFHHAPAMSLQIVLKDGATQEYKTSNKLLQSGFFDDNFLEKTEDFADIANSGDSKRKVSYYQFKVYDPSLFNDKFRVKEYRIVQ